ncbi:MAG: TetR/AcrR family transcriptional regulator [Desulfomonile sp.]|nr:TetR/AcrR family transcriptional regulator [Desulfomonile sp.]
MPTPLEKARKDPDSMKARILAKARQVFGQYGYHGATTRMIADEVGIDISTLYYHWGEKRDLYEAVILDVNEDLRIKLAEVEDIVHGRPMAERLDISLDIMTDYLFERPEISNLVLFRYFGKTRDEAIMDLSLPEFVSDIACASGLVPTRKNVPNHIKMRVVAMMNLMHSFVSGEDFFRSLFGIERDEYLALVKQTLKFILIPAFATDGRNGGTRCP